MVFISLITLRSQSSYMTCLCLTQLLDPTRLCNRFMVEPVLTISRSGFRNIGAKRRKKKLINEGFAFGLTYNQKTSNDAIMQISS